MLFTWRSNSVLIGGLVVAKCEQQSLDGPDENPSQAKVEYHVEHDDFNCGGGENAPWLEKKQIISRPLTCNLMLSSSGFIVTWRL